jgi:hypothetical protein
LRRPGCDVGLDMGNRIEREMEDFVNREAKQIAGKILGDESARPGG